MQEKLISKVWNIRNLFGAAVPGVLIWNNGKVAFITEEGVQFDEFLAELKDIKWPFLRMGLGFNTKVNGVQYKFSFSKPNPSAAEINIKPGNPYPQVTFKSQYIDDVSSLKDLKTDRATTNKWKIILAQTSS